MNFQQDLFYIIWFEEEKQQQHFRVTFQMLALFFAQQLCKQACTLYRFVSNIEVYKLG